MCMSPHEMSSAKIEEVVAWLDEYIQDHPYDHASQWEREQLAKILKERAEAGTYDDDFTDRSGNATARQGKR